MIRIDPKTGLWFVQVSGRHPLTRQPKNLRRKSILNEAQARKTEKMLEKQMLASFEETVTPTWSRLITEYLAFKTMGDWNEKTTEDAKLSLEAHTMDAWRSRKIETITSQEVKKLILEKVGHREQGTQKNLLKFVRGAFKYAVEMHYIASNPSPTMRFKIGDKVKAFLKEDEVRFLLLKAKEHKHPWYYHWCLAIYSGMRNGELFALSWDQVDLVNGIINVKFSWNKKGLKKTKSGDDRVVDIAPKLAEILIQIKKENPDSHFVLPRSRDWEKGEQARILRGFLTGIGLRPVRFHDLRATFATMLLIKGVEPIKVMVMGGWKDMKTMQIYMRTAGVEVRGVSKVLDFND